VFKKEDYYHYHFYKEAQLIERAYFIETDLDSKLADLVFLEFNHKSDK
jgi:hypothetical protein